uniref:Anion exchange protein n=1 Tax=Ditylenchus dipsaci TaxID=166011 RepID=A0A915D932_9BILA
MYDIYYGDTPSENLDVLQELLTTPHTDDFVIDKEKEQSFTRLNSESAISNVSNTFEPCITASKPHLEIIAPKEVLVELYDLHLRDDTTLVDGFWEETARWINFHALLQLRKCMAKGAVVLDARVNNFNGLCELIATSMASEGGGHDSDSTRKIMQILQLRHNHVPDRKMSRISTAASSFFDRGWERNGAMHQAQGSAAPFRNGRSFVHSPPTINEDDEDKTDSAANTIHSKDGRFMKPRTSTPNVRLNMEEPEPETAAFPQISSMPKRRQSLSQFWNNTFADLRKTTTGSYGELLPYKGDVVLKNLPEGTESAQVFVGAIDTLQRARFVMIRLAEPTYMPEIVDVDGSYHELGRSISTLMANKHFNSIAYMVIPPGEVDSKRLLSCDEIKKALNRRRKEAEMSTQKVCEISTVESGGNGLKTASNGQSQPSTSEGSSDSGHGRSFGLDKRKKYMCFNGMINDLRNRIPLYWSDFKDALTFQCLTSVVFMFFASFAPAITFGGLMGKYTNEKMGTIETLFAQCICGIIWGIFSAQPLLIMSATGPVLIFEASLYTFCTSLELDFLTVRFYAGIWIFLISVCIVAVDGSRLLVFVTRFTEDIFATLISAIFIAESLHFVWHTFQENPVEDYNYYQEIHVNCQRNASNPLGQFLGQTNNQQPLMLSPLPPPSQPLPVAFSFDGQPEFRQVNETAAAAARFNAALMALRAASSSSANMQPRRVSCSDAEPNTALLTAIIIESFYLGRHLRRAIGDFGVLIAIAVVALLVHVCIPDPYLQRLDMPDHLNFTNPEKRGHGLVVSALLDRHNWYGVFVALVAALLVFILLFVETEITELLLMRKERGCRKGSGMNWDLVLMSLAHCSSLTVMKKKAPGARPEVDHVIEQRVTTIGVSVLIGLIAFAGSYLRLP